METSSAVVSRLVEANATPSLPSRLAHWYLRQLITNPVLTKSSTSSVVGMMADISAQLLTSTYSANFDARSTINYGLLGALLTGPATHHFYRLLDEWLPSSVYGARLLRPLADRFLFGALFLLVSLYALNRLEGRDHITSSRIVRRGFQPMFKANLKFWLPLQFVNVNFVPQQYRVLFGNVCAFCWVIILARRRRNILKEELKRRRDL